MFYAVYELHWRVLASRMLTLMTTLRIYRCMYERARFVFFVFLHPKNAPYYAREKKPKGISRMPLKISIVSVNIKRRHAISLVDLEAAEWHGAEF